MSAIACPLIALSSIPSAARTSVVGAPHFKFRLRQVTASFMCEVRPESAASITTFRCRRSSLLKTGRLSHW